MIYEHFAELPELTDKKLISKRPHPRFPLWIYNYTASAQHMPIADWSPALCDCRGLILDTVGAIVARPFPKFWNYEQVLDKIPVSEPFTVWEKVDGSLGILASWDGNLIVSTRGSFESEQAVWAAQWLAANQPNWMPPYGFTYLAEIVYPGNRIVVDYADVEHLVLLDVLDHYGICREDKFSEAPFLKAEQMLTRDIEALMTMPDQGREGFVVRWANGFRAKLKFDEYKRLHRLITQCSTRTIWELLRTGQSTDELMDRVPVEFAEWAGQQISGLRNQFELVSLAAMDAFNSTPGRFESRKDFAMWAKQQSNCGLLFSLLDGKSIDAAVWKLVEPAWSTPFRRDEEA